MNYDDLRALFHSFVLQPDNTVETFIMSHDTRTLNTQPGQEYPQLQMDVISWGPEIFQNIKAKKTLNTQIAIVSPVGTDEWATQDKVMDDLELEMEKLLSYLETKRRLLKLGNITSIGRVIPIEFSEHASLFGWAVELSIKTSMPCYYNDTNTYTVVHLVPGFESGETELSIAIDGTQYDADWDDEAIPKDRPINDLVALINTDTGTHNVTAQRYLDTLILTHSTAVTTPAWTAVAGNHGWTAITI